MRQNQEIETILRHELKVNGMILPPLPSKTQKLLECLSSTLQISLRQLHEKICQSLAIALKKNELPRRLSFIKQDETNIDDYRKNPELVNYFKVTLQMISLMYETKVTVYTLNKYDFAVGQIVNEKNYQKELKLARIGNNFYEVKDASDTSYAGKSNMSMKIFQAFKAEKNVQPDILPLPMLTKSVTTFEEPNRLSHHEHLQKSLDDLSMDIQRPSQQQDDLLIGECSVGQSKEEQYNSKMSQQQMFYYNQYPQNMYYAQPYGYGNKSEGYINSFTSLPPNQPQQPMSPNKLSSSRKQISTLEINLNERYSGRLKFFDQAKNYGFIIMDADQSDIFVHCDDLQKAGINKDKIKSYKQSQGLIRFSFKVMSYFGKYKESRKAVDLQIIDDGIRLNYQ